MCLSSQCRVWVSLGMLYGFETLERYENWIMIYVEVTNTVVQAQKRECYGKYNTELYERWGNVIIQRCNLLTNSWPSVQGIDEVYKMVMENKFANRFFWISQSNKLLLITRRLQTNSATLPNMFKNLIMIVEYILKLNAMLWLLKAQTERHKEMIVWFKNLMMPS